MFTNRAVKTDPVWLLCESKTAAGCGDGWVGAPLEVLPVMC